MDNSDHIRFYSSSSQRFIDCRLPLWTSQSWTSHAVLDWTCPLGWNLFQSDPCLSSDPATQATLQSLGCFSWLSSTIIYASSFVCSILSSQHPFAPAIAPADRGRHWLQRALWAWLLSAQRRVSSSQKLRYSHRNETGFSLFAKWVPRLKLFLLDRKFIGVCSLLTSMQNLGLITCVWIGVGQRARLSVQEQSHSRVWSDSSQRRWSWCPRKVASNRRKKSQEYPRVTWRADKLVSENACRMTRLRMSCVKTWADACALNESMCAALWRMTRLKKSATGCVVFKFRAWMRKTASWSIDVCVRVMWLRLRTEAPLQECH